MMKMQKGYSMVVLVIAITVILILVSTAVSVLQVSREKTNITNFIFDLTTVQEEVQNFYTSTGTLPVETYDKIDMNELNNNSSNGILSQLHVYDNENYYYIDLSKIGTVALKDSNREYIVNEGSLKVYVKTGTEYSNMEDESVKKTYYTLTTDLVEGLEQYVSQEEEMLVLGNPVVWSSEANLRLVLPRQTLATSGDKSWDKWTFKWDFGPKTADELAQISDTDSSRNFEYGDILKAKSNGIYSIYARDPEGNVTVLNVNVSKIDDITPTYKFISEFGKDKIQIVDNETGIKSIRYKTFQNYKDNIVSASENKAEDLQGRTNIDYYLIDGIGRDLIYDLAPEIDVYISEKATIEKAMDAEVERHNKWIVENNNPLITPEEISNENENHENLMLDLNNQLIALYEKYPYLLDIYGKTDASRLVVYVEDYSGNATVIGVEENISLEILANSYNISLEGL